jgi:hypothetical protein
MSGTTTNNLPRLQSHLRLPRGISTCQRGRMTRNQQHARTLVRSDDLDSTRDMIAQASLAASQLLGSNADSPSVAGLHLQLNDESLKNLQFGADGVTKPISPRLIPLGSPGPVTPMELESEDSGGCCDGVRVSPTPSGGAGSDGPSRVMKADV